MDYKTLLKNIRDKDMAGPYLLYGNEVYIIDKTVKYIKEEFIDEGFESLNYVEIKGKDMEFKDIMNACETLPFMSDKKLVLIEDSLLFQGNNSIDGKWRDLKEDLKTYLDRISQDTILLIVDRNSELKKNNSIYKKLNSLGRAVEMETLSYRDFESWIKKEFREDGKTIDMAELRYLIDKTSYLNRQSDKSLYDVKNELNKIVDYLGQRKTVSKEDIDVLLKDPLENNIFNLLSAISRKNGEEALRIFNEIYLSGQAALFILHMIVRQLRNMLYISSLKSMGYDDNSVRKKTKLSYYEYNKLIGEIRNFKEEDLKRFIAYALETDKAIKTGQYEDRLALERLISKLCFL